MVSAEHTIPGISAFESGLRPQRVVPYRIYPNGEGTASSFIE